MPIIIVGMMMTVFRYDYPYSDNENAIDVIPIFEEDPKSRWINKKNDKNEKKFRAKKIGLGERSRNGNDGETFIMLKNGLLLKDFGNETLLIESTASWINYFDELLSNGINNNKTSFTVEINNQIENLQEQQNNIGTSSTSSSQY
nr:3725_t:CDS:2 [Entrophospora candida]